MLGWLIFSLLALAVVVYGAIAGYVYRNRYKALEKEWGDESK